MFESVKTGIINCLKLIATGVIANSFWICLVICMISLILYVGGLKKAGRYCTVSLIVYVLLEALGSAFL